MPEDIRYYDLGHKRGQAFHESNPNATYTEIRRYIGNLPVTKPLIVADYYTFSVGFLDACLLQPES